MDKQCFLVFLLIVLSMFLIKKLLGLLFSIEVPYSRRIVWVFIRKNSTGNFDRNMLIPIQKVIFSVIFTFSRVFMWNGVGQNVNSSVLYIWGAIIWKFIFLRMKWMRNNLWWAFLPTLVKIFNVKAPFDHLKKYATIFFYPDAYFKYPYEFILVEECGQIGTLYVTSLKN